MQKKLFSGLKEKIRQIPFWYPGVAISLRYRHQEVSPLFHDFVRALIPNFPYKYGGVKSLARIEEKAYSELGGNLAEVDDIIRGAFVVDTFSEMQSIDLALENFFQDHNIHYERRNKFTNPDPNKYKSLMYKFDLGNNIHAEIQVSISAFENIYDESHRNYEQIRRYQANGETSGAEEAEIQALIARNNELHSGAWNAVKDDYAAVYGREIDPR